MQEGSVELGGDADCELCGPSWNRFEWWLDDGRFELRLSVGCYGGDSLTTSDRSEALSWVFRLAEQWPEAAGGFAAEIEAIRAAGE